MGVGDRTLMAQNRQTHALFNGLGTDFFFFLYIRTSYWRLRELNLLAIGSRYECTCINRG
jgi:hypothetical protein